MVVYKDGDVLASNETVIAHGCNCLGGFGSGFAKAVAERYPDVKTAYLLRHAHKGWKLGDIQPCSTLDGTDRLIVNCATQERYGPKDQGPYVSYPAIRTVMKNLVRDYPSGFAMPKMGAGLAGGNWDIISEIINEESGPVEVRVYVPRPA